MKAELKQGTRIKYNINNELKGTGKIVGVAHNDLPIIGVTYIIEPDTPIKNEVYDYSHFVLPENQFELI